MEIIVCGQCKTTFKAAKSANRKYCSIKCSNLGHKGLLSGDRNPSKRLEVRKKMSESQRKRFGPKKNKYCVDCNKVLSGHSDVKRCKECNWKYYSGENHPHFNKNKGKRIRVRDIEKGYSTLFTPDLKKEIFERDSYTCQYCNTVGGTLHCHHIDYNKRNISYDNLITLCNSCHGRTNSNRGYWINTFKKRHRVYSLIIGRFQGIHEGHIKLIRTVLDEGKNVCIALRKENGDKNNPYTLYERLQKFEEIFKEEVLNGRVMVIDIPDIEDVVYGRDVGWSVREIRLDEETEKISATEIRKNSK
jgi:cytidyltransferase-like protein